MLRSSCIALTATPATYSLYNPSFAAKPFRKSHLKKKLGDTAPQFDKGPIEWLPRPVKLAYYHIDELRDWMMRETLDGKTDEFNKLRELQREWGQHPLRPVLGDVEPRLPKNLFKANHIARRRFLLRWHKANHPLNWAWLPRTATHPETPLHRISPAQFPENWKSMLVSGNTKLTR